MFKKIIIFSLIFVLSFMFTFLPIQQAKANEWVPLLSATGYALAYSAFPYVMGGLAVAGASYFTYKVFSSDRVKQTINTWYGGLSSSAKGAFDALVSEAESTGASVVNWTRDKIDSINFSSLLNFFKSDANSFVGTSDLSSMRFSDVSIYSFFSSQVPGGSNYLDALTYIPNFSYKTISYSNTYAYVIFHDDLFKALSSTSYSYYKNGFSHMLSTTDGFDHVVVKLGLTSSNYKNSTAFYYSATPDRISTVNIKDGVYCINSINDVLDISNDSVLGVSFPGSELIDSGMTDIDVPDVDTPISVPLNPGYFGDVDIPIPLVPQHGYDVLNPDGSISIPGAVANDIPFTDTIPLNPADTDNPDIPGNPDIPANPDIPVIPPFDIPDIGTGEGAVSLDFSPLLTAAETLTNKFPFSIPWDLKRSFESIVVPAKAPKWTINFTKNFFVGGTTVDIDFAIFEKWAVIIRWGILIAFNFALILASRKLIGG